MKKLFLLMAMALPVCLFTACSSDDDEDGGDAPGGSMSSSVTEIKGSDGKTVRLSSDGYYNYSYDEKSNLTGIYEDYVTLQVSNNPFKVSGDFDSIDLSMTAEFNNKGYFSKMKSIYKYDVKEENYSIIETINENVTFSYDNEGHLTKITGTTKATGTENGVKYTVSYTGVATYTWKNGVLVEATSVSTGTEDGETWTESETATFQFDDNYPNPCLQYTISQENLGEIEGAFQRLGFCGKGSAKLPSSVVYVDIDTSNGEETYNREYTVPCSYTFNNNGTVKTETCKNTYYYTYTNEAAEDEPLPHNLPMAKAAKQASSLRPLFFSKRLHRNRQK